MTAQPADDRQLYQNIKQAVQQGRPEWAIRLLESRAWERNDALLWNNLGVLYHSAGWLTEAEVVMRRAVGHSPHAQAFVDNLLQLLASQGLPFSAMQVLRSVAAAGAPEVVWRSKLRELEAKHPVQRVSVYTPGYASEGYIERCLRGIRAQTYPVHEIILVDDRSPDRSTEIALRQGVRVFYHQENLGLAASCNTALAHCTGDFLVKVDTDVDLLPTWLERAMPAFDDDRTAGVGGWLIEHCTTTIADRCRRFYMAQHRGPERVIDAPLFGADCVFRIDALKKVGGWNASYRTNFEDFDLSQRLTAAGFRLVYEPAARARHLRRDTVADVVRTHWSWIHPVVQDQGAYDSIPAAAALVRRNRSVAVYKINSAVQAGDFELTYPSFLGHYWFCLRDLQQVLRRNKATPAAVGHTAWAVFLLSRRQMRSSFAIPTAVAERTLGDLMPLVRGLLTGPELQAFDSEIAEDTLLASEESSALLQAVRQRLPHSDESYIRAFLGEPLLSDVTPILGALVGVSSEALLAEQQEWSGAAAAPIYVLFNPPVSEPKQPLGGPAAARRRWRRPSLVAETAARLRSAGARVLILDAVAMQLDRQDAHERVLGAEPAAVVYVAADGDIDRLVGSARFLALTGPPALRLILAHADPARDRHPVFHHVCAGIPILGKQQDQPLVSL